jgi:hypothetical protein
MASLLSSRFQPPSCAAVYWTGLRQQRSDGNFERWIRKDKNSIAILRDIGHAPKKAEVHCEYE